MTGAEPPRPGEPSKTSTGESGATVDAATADDADDGASGRGGDERESVERRVVGGHVVRGVAVDAATRCGHYDTDRDVVAIRFACCGEFYPCHACHEERADHDAVVWARSSFDELAVLCGACGRTLSIATYLDCEHTCPACGHAFNPGCGAHADRYFDVQR